MSTDGTTWDSITNQPLLDLAVNAGDPETVYATTDRGQLVSSTGGTEPVPVPGAPTLTAVDFEPGGPLVGVTPEGAVIVSPDGRTSWTEAGTLDGPVQALDAAPGRWHAATSTGVYESRDNAATWNLVLDASH